MKKFALAAVLVLAAAVVARAATCDSISTQSPSNPVLDQVAHTITYTFNGTYILEGCADNCSCVQGCNCFYTSLLFKYGYGSPTSSTTLLNRNSLTTYSINQGGLTADQSNWTVQAAATDPCGICCSSGPGCTGNLIPCCGSLFTGNVITFKTNAVDPTAGTPTASSITSTAATISDNYFPNTLESTATVWLEYRKVGDANWVQAGSQDAGKSGYAQLRISRDLAELQARTQYEFRLNMTRTTNNVTSFQSAISSFTTQAPTQASTPTVGSCWMSKQRATSVTFNCFINPRGNAITAYRFVAGIVTGRFSAGPFDQPTPWQGPDTGGVLFRFSTNVTGLVPSTQYHFKGQAVSNGVTYESGVCTFGTLKR